MTENHIAGIAKLVLRGGKWARSEFPHPLVTLDFDADDNLLAVSAPVDHVQIERHIAIRRLP